MGKKSLRASECVECFWIRVNESLIEYKESIFYCSI